MAQVEDLKILLKVQDAGGTQVIEKLQNQLRGLQRAANQASTSGIDVVAQSVRGFDASGKKNIETLRAQVGAMKALRDQAVIGSSQFKKLTADINKYSAALNKAEGRKGGGGRLAGLAKGVGAVAAGGVFGGAEGAIGGLAGLAIGGPVGAGIGAAIGAQVGGLRQALGGTAEYAANLDKLRIALKGVTTSQGEYQRGLSFIQETTERFAVPQEIVTRQFTKLQASVQGAGGNLEDTKTAFNGIVAAVRATGGSLADVDAALTATAQVFSKGKVSAEELRQQIGERLPGAFTLFAESMGLTPQELDKALEQGKVTLQDFQKFAVKIFERYGKNAEAIAKGPASAGARLQVQLERLNESVGRLLRPIGEAFQNFFGSIVKDIVRAADALARFMNMAFDEEKLSKAQAQVVSLTAQQENLPSSASNRLRQSIANQLREARATVARQIRLRDASAIDVQQPTAGGGLSYGGGDGAGAGAGKRLPQSQKLVDLTNLLAERTGKVGEHELATLRYMIARQKILDNNLLPATNRERALNEALAKFRKDIENIQKRETKELERQNKLQAQFNKELEDRKFKLGLISQEEYNRLLIERERERLQAKYGDLPGGAGMVEAGVALKRQELDPSQFQEMRKQILGLKRELKELLNPVNLIVGAANSIGESFTQSFRSVIDGSATTQEALASFFRNIGNFFLDMAQQIIAKMITLAILNATVGLLPGGSVSAQTPDPLVQPGVMVAGNGAAFDKGVKRYAMGGIVNKPTLFKYGQGGTGRFGLMGEAGPEAIIPLKRGADGKLGVAGGGGVNVGEINIKVENTGEQLSPAAQKQIANQVQGIVMANLVNERRSGGVLR